ncbi:MAG: hypothetical protein Q9198_005156, partial [Flavoplaca austrocitrina]
MAAVIATLYEVTESGLRAKCPITFPLVDEDRISHFIHVPENDDDQLSVWTSADLDNQSPTFVLHTRQNALELEARSDSIEVKSHSWSSESSETSFVRLPTSNAYEHVLRSLAPDELFRIRAKLYLLRVGQAPPVQDVQVMSSRPSTNDADTPPLNGQSDKRSSTPNLTSGMAVLETPVAKRYQDPTEVAKSSTTSVEEDASQGEDDQAVVVDNVGVAEPTKMDHADNVIDLQSRSVLVEADPDVHLDDDASTTTTDSSTHELPHSNVSDEPDASALGPVEHRRTSEAEIPAQRSPKKRSASPFMDNAGSEEAIQPKPSTAGGGHGGPPRKRQRLVPAAAEEESQNSVQSTIHVELPSVNAPSEPSSRLQLGPVNDIEPSQESARSTLSTPRNQRKPTEPSSSTRSTRQHGQDSSQETTTRVVFTSSTTVDESTVYAKFLRQHNVKQVKKIQDCDVLCTGKGEVKRTSKLLLATLMGKEVVTDEWIIQSAQQNRLLKTTDFIPEDKKRKQEWGTSLSDAIKRGRDGLKPFEGWTINFTPSAKKDLGTSWSELKEICLAAGAE